jgi:hypothetical protein
MKAILLIALVLGASEPNDNTKYIEAMKKNIDALYKSQSIEEYQQVINTLERIGKAEKDKWEPYYYSSFGYVMMALKENAPAIKDNYLDQAINAVMEARKVEHDESEVAAIEGFVHMIRVTVDPQSRGPQYSGMAFQAFGKSLGVNPDNPRALALKAQMELGTAQFFGSPIDDACATMRLALEKFNNFTSEDPLAPRWGRETAESMKEQCR